MEQILQQILSELKDVKANQVEANTRLDGIDKQLHILQGDVTALKADMAHHNHTVEPQLKTIREGLEGWSERARQIDRHESKLENHGDRIFALECAIKTR